MLRYSPAVGLLLASLIALLTVPCLAATDPIAAQLDQLWKDRYVQLRVPDSAGTIRFNAQGERSGNPHEGLWALDSRIRVQKVKRDHNAIRIEGERTFVVFDTKTGKLEQAPSHDKVRVLIDVPDGITSAQEFMPTLAKIFQTKSEELIDVAPSYWKPCIEHVERTPSGGWTCGVVLQGKSKYPLRAPTGAANLAERVGGDVTIPRPIFRPDPDYTPVARSLRFQGTTILWVEIDETGHPSDIVIVRPLGLGLDDEAVRAVERWKFKPATKNGTPVAVQINVEVNFRLY